MPIPLTFVDTIYDFMRFIFYIATSQIVIFCIFPTIRSFFKTLSKVCKAVPLTDHLAVMGYTSYP